MATPVPLRSNAPQDAPSGFIEVTSRTGDLSLLATEHPPTINNQLVKPGKFLPVRLKLLTDRSNLMVPRRC